MQPSCQVRLQLTQNREQETEGEMVDGRCQERIDKIDINLKIKTQEFNTPTTTK